MDSMAILSLLKSYIPDTVANTRFFFTKHKILGEKITHKIKKQ
jgi:hypothetical protein